MEGEEAEEEKRSHMIGDVNGHPPQKDSAGTKYWDQLTKVEAIAINGRQYSEPFLPMGKKCYKSLRVIQCKYY